MIRFTTTLAILLFCLSARAGLVTQVRQVPLTPTDWSQTVTFDPFNAALGHLDSVELTAMAHTMSTFSATFTAPSTITLTAGPTAIQVADVLTLTTTAVTRQAQASGTTLVLPPAVAEVSGLANLPLNPAGLVLPVVATSHSSFHSDTGNGKGTVRTLAGVDLTLKYEYTRAAPVPEPPTGLVLASGLVLVGLSRNCAIAQFCRWRSGLSAAWDHGRGRLIK
jgi:hypothetical protein